MLMIAEGAIRRDINKGLQVIGKFFRSSWVDEGQSRRKRPGTLRTELLSNTWQ